MVASDNAFRKLLREHLRKTRAAKFGQFEHAWSFIKSASGGSHLPFRIGPGENILFEGELLDTEQPCSLRVTNNLTGPSGGGFHGQTENPGDRTIVVGESPATGQATLEFSCPTSGGGGGGSVSYCTNTFQTSRDRYEAIDDTDSVIFTVQAEGCKDIYHDAAADDWYCTGGIPFSPFFGDVGKFNPSFEWRGRNDAGRSKLVAHESQNDRVGVLGSEGGNTVLVIYDGSGGNQGGLAEPAALFRVVVSDFQFAEYDVLSDNAGFFYVASQNSDGYQNATPGEFRTIFKIDSSTGVIVNSFNTQTSAHTPFSATSIIRLALGPAGEVVACQVHDTGGDNTFRLDSDLNLVASDNIDWSIELGFPPFTFISFQRFVYPTFDEQGRIFIVSGDAFAIRYDNLLASRQFEKFLITGLSVQSDEIKNIGHNLDGKLILFGGGQGFGFTAKIIRFDNDGTELSRYTAPLPASDMVNLAGHVSTGGGGGPGPDLGTLFTSEFSTNPPGSVQAIAAVKYSDERFITGIFFNSVLAEFDVSKWKATHSVQGVITPELQWEYNSPL